MKKSTAKPYIPAENAGAARVQESADTVLEVGAFNAKTHFSDILSKVSAGATFYITKRGKRVAEIRPIFEMPKRRNLGDWRGRIWVAPDFDAPLDDFKEYME